MKIQFKGLKSLFSRRDDGDGEIENKEKVKAKGIHILTICDATSVKAQDLQHKIEQVSLQRQYVLKWKDELLKAVELRKLWTEYKYLVEELHKFFKVRESVVHNVTTTNGRSVLVQRLAGVNTYSGNVSHTALGSNNTAPTVGDTTLVTETYRKALSSGTFLNNVGHLETFYSATEVSGTFEEYGMFIDGSAAVDSGQLFNRFTETKVKSLTETLNVNSQITLSDA